MRHGLGRVEFGWFAQIRTMGVQVGFRSGTGSNVAGRRMRSHEEKTTAEVHDYHDERTGVLAAALAKRAPGYIGLGFPDPRRLALTPSAR